MGSSEQEDCQEQRCGVPWRLATKDVYQGESPSSSTAVNLDHLSPLIKNAKQGVNAQENGDMAKGQAYPTDGVGRVEGTEQSHSTDDVELVEEAEQPSPTPLVKP